MVSRIRRKKMQETRKHAEKRYEKQLRHNRLFAKPGVHEFVIVLDNLKPSFNIGKIFRSAEAFGADSLCLIGTKFFDANAAKGAFKRVPTLFHQDFEECYTHLCDKGCTIYVLDPEAEKSLHSVSLPVKSAFLFGHEEFGFSFDCSDYEAIVPLKIEQVGLMESLNVSNAASIVMYEYFRQHVSPNYQETFPDKP